MNCGMHQSVGSIRNKLAAMSSGLAELRVFPDLNRRKAVLLPPGAPVQQRSSADLVTGAPVDPWRPVVLFVEFHLVESVDSGSGLQQSVHLEPNPIGTRMVVVVEVSDELTRGDFAGQIPFFSDGSPVWNAQ